MGSRGRPVAQGELFPCLLGPSTPRATTGASEAALTGRNVSRSIEPPHISLHTPTSGKCCSKYSNIAVAGFDGH